MRSYHDRLRWFASRNELKMVRTIIRFVFAMVLGAISLVSFIACNKVQDRQIRLFGQSVDHVQKTANAHYELGMLGFALFLASAVAFILAVVVVMRTFSDYRSSRG